jgi:hypothetical protein
MKRVALALTLLFVAACADRPTEPELTAESSLKRGGASGEESAAEGAAGKVKFQLTLLHNNDGESALLSEDRSQVRSEGRSSGSAARV